jgi:ribonuclease P protein component
MERLRQRADFLAAAASSRVNAPAFVLQRRNRDDTGPVRVGFTVTKKNGTAPERNRIKRRLRELVKRVDPLSMRAHSDYVLVGRRTALNGNPQSRLLQKRRDLTLPACHKRAAGGKSRTCISDDET